MKYSKKPAGLTAEQSVLYYASKMTHIDSLINDSGLMSAKCDELDYVYVDGQHYKMDENEKTCNQNIYAGEDISRCCGCESNSSDYKLKRKYKQAFNTAQKQLIKYTKKITADEVSLYEEGDSKNQLNLLEK